MSLTLKQMMDAAALESGISTETAYATSTDDQVKRLFNLAKRTCRDIVNAHEWQGMRKTYTFSLSTQTTYPLPEDFEALIPDTSFTDGYFGTVDMHTSSDFWGYLQSNTGGSGPRWRFRILGDEIKVYNPVSGEDVRFEYLSNTPVLAADGMTYKERFTADTDTFILDDDLFIKGLVWRYKKLVGIEDWQVDFQDYNNELKVMKGRDAGSKTIVGGALDSYVGPYTNLWVTSD